MKKATDLYHSKCKCCNSPLLFVQGNAVQAAEQALNVAEEGAGSSPASHTLSSEIRSAAEEVRFRALLASGLDEDAAAASQKVALGNLQGITLINHAHAFHFQANLHHIAAVHPNSESSHADFLSENSYVCNRIGFKACSYAKSYEL